MRDLMTDTFNSLAHDALDMIYTMRVNGHSAEQINEALSTYLEGCFTALYDVWVTEDDQYINKDDAYEYVMDNYEPQERDY